MLKKVLFDLLNGTIAGIISIILWEIIKITYLKIHKCKLKQILKIINKTCCIVSPIFLVENKKDELIHYRDAYAFVHIIELFKKINIEPDVMPFNKIPETYNANDLIIVGGPLSNKLTSDFLKEFCKNLNLKLKSLLKNYPKMENIHGELL